MNFSVLVSDNIQVEEEELLLTEFIQSTQRVLSLKAEKTGQKIEFDIDSELPEKVISDQKKLTQLLYNLIDFSSNRMGNNGVILVQTIAKNVSENEMTFCINVSDTASIIPSAKVKELLQSDKLLENYSPEDDARKDEFGMAIVSKLVEIMNGEIAITSKDVGTKFKVELPIKIVKKVSIQPGDAPDSPLKILLVEDHFLNQIATKKVLTTWSDKITVDIAENGLIGVEKYREHGYDLILMDMQMPVMNGLDASIKIREMSNVPIIALTANASKQEADKCFKAGINEYITKPFKPQDLYAKILGLMVTVNG